MEALVQVYFPLGETGRREGKDGREEDPKLPTNLPHNPSDLNQNRSQGSSLFQSKVRLKVYFRRL